MQTIVSKHHASIISSLNRQRGAAARWRMRHPPPHGRQRQRAERKSSISSHIPKTPQIQPGVRLGARYHGWGKHPEPRGETGD